MPSFEGYEVLHLPEIQSRVWIHRVEVDDYFVVKFICNRTLTLHWGLRSWQGGPWLKPPERLVPVPSDVKGYIGAAQTLLPCSIPFEEEDLDMYSQLVFVFLCEDRWIKCNGSDFVFNLKKEVDMWEYHAKKFLHALPHAKEFYGGFLAATEIAGQVRIDICSEDFSEAPPILHWGLKSSRDQRWTCPPRESHPKLTYVYGDGNACRTPFVKMKEPVRYYVKVDLRSVLEREVVGLTFVIVDTCRNLWLKDTSRGKEEDFVVPSLLELKKRQLVLGSAPPPLLKLHPLLSDLESVVVDVVFREASASAVDSALSSRFRTAFELLVQALPDLLEHQVPLPALLFTWFRLSYLEVLRSDFRANDGGEHGLRCTSKAERQLCDLVSLYIREGRNPEVSSSRIVGRELDLGDRFPNLVVLFFKLAFRMLWRFEGEDVAGDPCRESMEKGKQPYNKLLDIFDREGLSRGSDPHFFEQWLSKLRASPSSEDIVICDALLAFFKSKDVKNFWGVLDCRGLRKEVLVSLPRPLTLEPFLPREESIGEFEELSYLIRTEVCGIPFRKALSKAKEYLVNAQKIEAVLTESPSLLQIREARAELKETIDKIPKVDPSWVRGDPSCGHLSELIAAELALESLGCLEIDRFTSVSSRRDLDRLLELSACVFVEFCEEWMYSMDEETACLVKDVKNVVGDSSQPTLLTKSVCDRLQRWIVTVRKFFFDVTSPLFRRFQCAMSSKEAPDTADRFSLEAFRLTPLPSLERLLAKSQTYLRKKADLPPWQIYSFPSTEIVAGRVQLLSPFSSASRLRIGSLNYEPSILVSRDVATELEGRDLPEGVVAIIVTGAPPPLEAFPGLVEKTEGKDILLAACFDDSLCEFSGLEGRWMSIKVSADRCAISLRGVDSVSPGRTSETPEETTRPLEQMPVEELLDSSGGSPSKMILDRLETQLQLLSRKSNTDGKKSPLTTLVHPDGALPPSPKLISTELIFPPEKYSKLLTLRAPEIWDRHSPWGVKARDLTAYGLSPDFTKFGDKTRRLVLLQRLSSLHPGLFEVPEFVSFPSETFKQHLSGALGFVPPRDQFGSMLDTLTTSNAEVVFKNLRGLLLPEERLLGQSKDYDFCLGAPYPPPWFYNSFNFLLHTDFRSCAWEAMRRVWASAFSLRAWLAVKKSGGFFSALEMGVVAQVVGRLKYSFTIYTANPSTGNQNEIHGEIVCGFSDGLFPPSSGRTLSFRTLKGDPSAPEILSFPSRSFGYYPSLLDEHLLGRGDPGGGFIFRPDFRVRGEAEGGLELLRFSEPFESYLVLPPLKKHLVFSEDPLVRDRSVRDSLIPKLLRVGRAVEEGMAEGALKVEGGVLEDDTISVFGCKKLRRR